jgi:hypothetical protein
MTPFEVGELLPRAERAFTTEVKWDDWILAPSPGHGADWFRVFGSVSMEKAWAAILDGLENAPIRDIRMTIDGGISCGVQMMLTLNGRTAPIRTAWHYADPHAAPRLVTAYPTT